MQTPTKYCYRCASDLPYEAFYRNRGAKDGLSFRCIECSRTLNRERMRQKRLDPEQRAILNATVRRTAKRHPDRARAREFVKRLVKRGLLPKAATLTCRDCGGAADHYDHHLGYARDNWGDVQAVCIRCHGKRTGLQLRERGKAAPIKTLRPKRPPKNAWITVKMPAETKQALKDAVQQSPYCTLSDFVLDILERHVTVVTP